MAPTPTTEYKTALGQNSYLSLGLVLALLAGAVAFGQGLERLNSIEDKVDRLSATVERLQMAPNSTGR
ncbi:MAG: hypothetical protein HEQ38_17040 [Gemmatimonas sp.]|jgi:hypothetical protein|nr:hypothetical protein [Gemmatimonas sp.]